MTDAPRKPFWKRKRWIAAAILWLVMMYPLSRWPVAYFAGRGWLPQAPLMAFYSPVHTAADFLRPRATYRITQAANGTFTATLNDARSSYRPKLLLAIVNGYYDISVWFENTGTTHAGGTVPPDESDSL